MAELAGRSLREFIPQAWPILEPSTPYLHNWHIDAIAEHLEAVSLGQMTRLIVNIPPRYMKSITVNVMWPVWEWIRAPHIRHISASYSQSLSTKHNLDRRTIIQSPWYQRHWSGAYQLAGDHNLKTEFVNDRRGHMIATSVGGTSTGKGGDRLIVDDPLNPKEAASDAFRVAANTWFDQTFYSRLDNKKTGAIVVVMQRLHEQDLTGHLLAKESGWTHLCLPAEAPRRTVITLPISGREITRPEGDILWPEREGPKELAETKRNLGSYGYAGQYEQNPAPAEGGILKRHWWRFWCHPGQKLPPVEVKQPNGEIALVHARELPTEFDEMLQSWDMTFKDTDGSDFVAGQVWGRRWADKFLLDQVWDRLDFVATCEALIRLSGRWPKAFAKLVEDKANGPAVISTLRHKVPGLIAVNPEGGKMARASAVSPEIEAGNVYLPHPHIAPWVEAFIGLCAAFPNAANDDPVDSMTQALLRWIGRLGDGSATLPGGHPARGGRPSDDDDEDNSRGPSWYG
jgi:predicted phage terminase large subunit-like protein